jgi:Glycosyl transferase family 90
VGLEVRDGVQSGHQGRVRISILAVAVTALSVRVELFRQIIKKTECAISSAEIYLPLLLALYDAFRFQKHEGIAAAHKPDAKLYDKVLEATSCYILRSRFRYILSVAVFCYGCRLLLDEWLPLNSNYICPIVLKQQITIPWMQRGCVLLDLLLAVIVYEKLPKSDGSGLSPRRSVVLWSSTLTVTVLVWSVIAVIVYCLQPEFRFWLLLLDTTHILGLATSMVLQSLLFSCLCITTLHSILAYGFLSMALDLLAVPVVVSSTRIIWTLHQPYPPASATVVTLASLLLYFGWWSLQYTCHLLGVREHGPSRKHLLLLLILVFVFPTWIKQASLHYHPIDLLIYDGARQHEAYFNATQLSSALASNVARYKNRYGRNPPPGFDVWWEYATNKSTLILDDYDEIDDDVLPFYSVNPADIRRATWEMVSNPWNEISGITIRDGVAAVQENVLPTHRWMLEGVAVLINSFARYLPDMDLAFNLNDESRVAVPYDKLNLHRTLGRANQMFGTDGFSAHRAGTWQGIPEEEYHSTGFRDGSFRNTFARWGSIGCPPSSPARSHPYIPSQSSICFSCTSPHSLGQFLANWTIAADICHQPDMAHLHGFYLSPAAFKTSLDLVPVFSQSKPHGFNDILYPSAWNYMDKVIYAPTDKSSGAPGSDDWRPAFPDPTFHEKYNTLFWRGATSEGVSSGDHTWRGMTRQRLVHLTNNLTSHQHDAQTVLLPDPKISQKLKYTLIPGDKIASLNLDTDIAIVDHIARCGGIGLHDCSDQAEEFALVAPSDFQTHWRYRYLFDLDGAGFSGRFLPFLQSKSLPFKTALFREWYDSRITAWKHFVPLDGRLHGVYSTLAYFAGVHGNLPDGRRVEWEGHVKEGEKIAWAARVLRKEDMEVYFFRLLLEWGRVTDDNREKLGFDIKGDGVEE